MARQGVAIKVKIGLKLDGSADYPNWKDLPMVVANQHDENPFQIVKWRYDCCGHAEDTPDSPAGQQWGMMIVTEQFANEAVAMYPAQVNIMTEIDARAFWNNNVNKKTPADRVNSKALTDLNAELALRKSLTQDTTVLEAKIIKALNRDDDTESGVSKNKEKDFDDAKVYLGFTIKKP
jgi:hypothetical protein